LQLQGRGNGKGLCGRLVLLLAGALIVLAAGPGSVLAQTVSIETVEPGNRSVYLTWSKALGDTLEPDDRVEDAERLFARYRIWRAAFPDTADFKLLRSYDLFDSTWTFDLEGIREFSDPDSIFPRGSEHDPDFDEVEIAGPHNGFAYYYSVTWSEAEIDSSTGTPRAVYFPMQTPEQGKLGPIFPARTARTASPLLNEVKVVPNPYNPNGFADQQAFPGPPRVQFTRLPEMCQITIYTVAGDKVRTLEHEDATDSEDWDLKNADGREVSAGIYIYYIEASGQTQTGRFVIIR